MSDARPRDPMILRLERAGGVNDDFRRDARERRGEIAIDIDRMPFARMESVQRSGERPRLCH
jgi:hypothetical protein